MQYSPLGRSGLIALRACLGTVVFGEEGRRGADEGSSLEAVGRPEPGYPYGMIREFGARGF